MIWYEHGDVTLKPVERIPEDAIRLNHMVLRVGRSGHRHVANGIDAELFGVGTDLFLNAPNGAEIGHEEHACKPILPGVYAIGAQREYDHFAEEAREVQD